MLARHAASLRGFEKQNKKIYQHNCCLSILKFINGVYIFNVLLTFLVGRYDGHEQ